MLTTEFDFAAYRRALGCFATGIAVVTTCDESGEKFGITVNSFNSVSLDPPLVLWSIDLDSQCLGAFSAAEFFAVNVLASNQLNICERFAARGSDRFDGINCSAGREGQPLLPDFSAVFECRTENVYAGGDHKIIIGRVLRFEDRDTDPLIFYRGQYRS
jgi:3-hydroxy-9,10-secoandrosta-1,3,5(10)-triene-9,17-dione monooxygenase reductase component